MRPYGHMKYDPQKHHRRSIRLKGYDYSQAGAYYFTIVAQNRAELFGHVVDGEMQLNDAGEMLWEQWTVLPSRFANVELDEFIVMPNHVHGILLITDREQTQMGEGNTGQAQGAAPTADLALGNILGAWKSIVSGEYIKGVRQTSWEPFDRKLFQRNYWEHIVRNERELDAIRAYIINNPANWAEDDQNPKNVKPT